MSRWLGATLGLFALFVRLVCQKFPSFTEKWYAKGFYPLIRGILDYTINLLPFPAVYLIIAALLGWGYLFLKGLFRSNCGFAQKLKTLLRSVLNFSGWLIFFFLFLWGLNYYRIPLYQQLSLQAKPIGQRVLLAEMQDTQKKLLQIRNRIQPDSLALVRSSKFFVRKETLRKEMKQLLSGLGYSWRGRPTVKQLYPAGTMRKMGIFGIYLPFSGEGYLDPSLHPVEKSFTLAHELAHGFGVTDEGEANFVAWLVCSESKDSFLNYVGELKLFRYQLRDLQKMDAEAYKAFVGAMHPSIKADILDIQRSNLEIRPYFLELSRKSNDLYLKSQGVRAGVASYAQLPMLVFAWKSGKNQN
ncbi:DUF3810 domain-containing protein [Cyclobacterium lianum]|uniref:DUF3810 domain-containing protein n=1 Tax=Cyclobacterium lianum TaxID=388280 RepID=UPI0015B5B24E|nr:DUF3810 domain-containing protein [Cyclobacterium lianum]